MLSRHSLINFFPQETHLYPLLWSPGGKLKVNDSQQLAAMLQEKLPAVNYGWTAQMPFLEELCKAIGELDRPPSTVSGLLRFMLHFWEQKQGGSIVTGEKTPAHIYYALEILKEFPECKIVLMCRDPRAVALSEQIKLEKNTRVSRQFSAFNFIVRWSTAADLIRRLETHKNAFFLPYERLIAEPEACITELCGFLGIDFEEAMLDVGVVNSSFGDRDQTGVAFNAENLDRWKTLLHPRTLGLIESHLAPQMADFGYAVSLAKPGITPPLKQRVKLRAARLASRLAPAIFHHLNRNKKYRD